MTKDSHRYDDMLLLPPHRSRSHHPMKLSDRAAQFAPFAALTGYEDAVKEAARLTDEKILPDEEQRESLDRILQNLLSHPQEHPVVSFTCFIPDARKSGGSYTTITGSIKRADPVSRKIILYADNGVSDGQEIFLDDILEISEI
ncbi:MAG: YolD-like family protein [Eubacterium sp.]|nr:YolD-like family protein [Eubacterium sp.]MDD7210655.1 hypothetical protein [Lachnospiraceae bacterium]MDY5496397.1 hypothetical protein [Anaerobutyricum sp.]